METTLMQHKKIRKIARTDDNPSFIPFAKSAQAPDRRDVPKYDPSEKSEKNHRHVSSRDHGDKYHRDKDKYREKHRDRDRDHDRDRDRDQNRDRHRDKDRKSDRDRNNDRDRDRHRDKDKDRDRHKDRSKPIEIKEFEVKAVANGAPKVKSLDNIEWTTQKLPIYRFQNKILETVKSNQVVIISGDTGCGKSTQIPKYIWLDAAKNGSKCNIICTQPRRLAAINLARRVSEELESRLGDLVGYQIAMDSKQRGESTHIIFVTTGILLQKLIHEPDKVLSEYTHIILDEIHERDIDSDFIMIAIKHMLHKYPNLRLILMSATINAELFSKYFSSYQIFCCSKGIVPLVYDDAPSRVDEWGNTYSSHDPYKRINNNNSNSYRDIKVKDEGWESSRSGRNGPSIKKEEEMMKSYGYDNPNRMKEEDFPPTMRKPPLNDPPAPIVQVSEAKMYKIREYFLDTLDDFSKNLNTLSPKEFNRDRAIFINDCIQVALDIIWCILRNERETDWKPGSILVFLPGLNEIYTFIDSIEEKFEGKNDILTIIPLHSTLVDVYQDQLFEKLRHGQRKLILATNIAESSITIPDVRYVIDFCLTKEINYNPKTNMERLELSWSCVASARQRAGRTGRVNDGYCFRLVPKDFYQKKMMKFSKPELQRCPLDRLILKIKLLNKFDTTSIFGEPEKVLGRAIEPPNLENIDLAIRLLQDCGAVSLSDDSNPTGEITYLGQIYCDLPMDIRISKLCLLGFVFNSLRESIIVSSMIQQQRSIFLPDTKSHPRDQYLFCKTLLEYDKGDQSDSIMMLRIYDDWENKFGERLHRYDKPKRLINKKNVTYDENHWCRQRCLDPMILREVMILKDDIKRRLLKYNINEMYMSQVMDMSQTESISRLKILIAAAFFSKYLRSEINMQDRIMRSAETLAMNFKMDSFRTIVVNNAGIDTFTWTPEKEEAEEKIWRLAFNHFGEVDRIKFVDSKAYVMFTEATYKDAVLYILYLKFGRVDDNNTSLASNGGGLSGSSSFNARFFANKNSYAHSLLNKPNKTEATVALQQVLSKISGVDYMHIVQLNDAFTFKKISMDQESVNRFIFEERGKQNIPKVVVCYEYQERGHKGFARHTTIMPDYPMMLQLLVLLFSSTPELITDDDETRYCKIRIKEIELNLDYYLMDADLSDINDIRAKICKTFAAEMLLSQPPQSLWDDIINLLRRKRMKCIDQERWQKAFESERLTQAEKEKLRPTAPNNAWMAQMKPEIIQIDRPFLPEIKRKPLKRTSLLWNESRLILMREYETKYKQWKKERLQEMTNLASNMEMHQPLLICGKCGFKITDVRCLYESKTIKMEETPYRELKISKMVLYEFKYDDKDEFCLNPAIQTLINLSAEMTFYGCSNNHKFAIRFHNIDELFITDFSNLQILYPDLRCVPLDLHHFSPSEIDRTNSEALIIQRQKLANLECIVCFECFSSPQEFRRHLRDDRIHKNNIIDFTKNLNETT